jgi:bifunctional non-homologous end joining protein LigD
MVSRNGLEMSGQYPELVAEAGAFCRGVSMVVDGEIVAVDAAGRPSFGLLQRRMHVVDERVIGRLVKQVPVAMMVFDLLWVDGESMVERGYEERRRRLMEVTEPTGRWHVPPHRVGGGEGMLAAASSLGLEGVVAKRMGSLYRAGKRSEDWLKIKLVRHQEVVIGGYVPMAGGRAELMGALLVGYYRRRGEGRLMYAGRVGTGFSDEQRREMAQMLLAERQEKNPFATRPGVHGAIFCRPVHVAEVAFTEWTAGGALRHPTFRGMRLEKRAEDVVREEEVGG